MVVRADDGMDEISIHSETLTAELNNGTVTSATISPESFGFKRQSLSAIAVSNASDSLALVNSVFAGEPGPARDIVALNAGAAIYLADLANDMEEGVALALREIDDGKAKTHFSTFIETTQQLARGTS